MEKLAIIAFFLLIVQGMFAYRQIKNYQSRAAYLSRKGVIGIGKEKGTLKAGNLTILVSDDDGKIITGEKMEGITVFSRFKEIQNIGGITLKELKEEYAAKGKNIVGKKAMMEAIEELEAKLHPSSDM